MIKLRGLFLLILIGAFLFSVSFTKAVNGNNNVAASTTVQSDVITVRQGDDLQAAIDRAKPGDVIALEAGATFAGNFTLPNKQGRSDFITIRPAASDELLPSEDARVTPAYAAAMPKIISPNADPALRADAGAHHFRLVGLEITIAPDVMLNYGIVVLGEGRETDLAALPHDVVIDRCYIHGHKTADVARGVALNSATTEIINSYISEIHGIGFDTQAIAGWNGPGPFKIVNNYLEAAGENVMFGGADPKITDLVPADIEFRRNYCFKPLEWKEGILAKPADVATVALFNPASSLMPGATYYYRITARGRAGASVIATSAAADEIAVTLAPELNGVSITWSPVAGATEYRVFRTSDPPIAETRNWVFYTTSANVFDDTGDALSAQSGAPPAVGTRWSVKNLFELKNARRVLIDANLFENNWVDGQSGFAILFTVRNQDGTAPWSVVEDVTFTNNIVRHSAAGIMFIGRDNLHPSQQIKRVMISNNLFDDIGAKQWGNNGRWIQITETVDVKIDHNTAFQTGNLITAHGVPNQEFVFTNNIVPHNEFGIIGDGTATGNTTLDRYFVDFSLKKNVIVGAQSSRYPKKNFYPPTLDDVGFVDKPHGNYRLAASSQFKHAGTKDKDVGANIDEIERAMGRVVEGLP